jgi:hypothetical protein
MGLSETIVAFLESEDTRCDLDASGNLRDWSLGADAPPAAVIVMTPTDALKTTHAGLVTGSLDRSGLWEIAGVSLRRDSVSNFDGVDSVAQWVERLRLAGVDLVPIESDGL